MANCPSDQGKFSEAEGFYRQAVLAFQERFGELHPDTLYSCYNLAIILAGQERYVEAEQICRKVLAGQQRYQLLEMYPGHHDISG